MRWIALVVMIAMFGCHSTRHVDVRLAGNPQGAECFASCVQTIRVDKDDALETCVAACPGAVRDDCSGPACIETSYVSWWKTTLLLIGGTILLVAVAPNGPL